ncbi:hypothetical protein BCR34DRAFT_287246 [Clohesyomyces aquaticus]|uniref:DUF7580 domain-containing protein n=1 Tax=Clohesyomyces aquaticus TaxID=1231657 RepID=A0A1Y1ZR21_9PLEO|nr:hypothetical protein BCR34DRAFT_287246 [Clohesyomyces aquaticus]
MEVVGVVLSGIPLVLHALDNYQKAWNPAKDYWRWGNTIATIRMNIFLQKQQLDTTLTSLGLYNPTTIELKNMLMSQYPDKHDMFMQIIQEMERNVAHVLDMLEVDAKGKPKWSGLSSNRVQWEWRRVRRSFGRRERKEIIEQLQMWNNALKNCFEKPELPSMQEDRMVQVARVNFDERKCTAIRKNAQIIYEALESGFGCTCHHSHKSNVELNWHREPGSAPSTFNFAFSFATMDQEISPERNETWRAISAKIESVSDVQSGTTVNPVSSPAVPSGNQPHESKRTKVVHFLGLPPGKDKQGSKGPVPPPPAVPSQAALAMPKSSTSPSISPGYIKLCGVLRASPNPLHSLGYLPLPNADQGEHMHLFGAPGSKRKPQRTVSLQSLLSRVTTTRRLALSRKQRLGIAAALAWAVLHLADSAWLGKQLDDESIQLFLESEIRSTSETLSTNPYLSCSFKAAATQRESPTVETEEEKFQSNQIANITLFTLAIRLMELGLNRPFDQLRQEHKNGQLSGDPNIQPAAGTIDDFKVAMDQLDELYFECGTSYAYAVQRCLKLEFPGPGYTKSFEHRSFRQDFFSGVVAPLQATYEITPGSCSPADL